MSIIVKPNINNMEIEKQENTLLMNLDETAKGIKNNVTGMVEEVSAPGAESLVKQDRKSTSNIRPSSASRVLAATVATKGRGASALTFELKEKATPLYYQNPNSNLH